MLSDTTLCDSVQLGAMNMETTDFERIASSLTVLSICSPFGPDIELGPEDDVNDRIDFDDPDSIYAIELNLPSRVLQSGRCLGIVWYDDFSDAYTVRGALVADPPLSGDYLSADTNILEAIYLFSSSSNDCYYILEKMMLSVSCTTLIYSSP